MAGPFLDMNRANAKKRTGISWRPSSVGKFWVRSSPWDFARRRMAWVFLLLTILFNTLSIHGPGRRGTGAACPAHSQQPIRRHDRCVGKPDEQVSWGERACSG